MQINGITYKEEAIKAAKNKRIIMNNLIARFNVNIASKEDLELLLSNIQFKSTGTFELDIMKNVEYDNEKSKEFPDGFLYFKYTVEYYKNENTVDEYDIQNSESILKILWENDIPAIIICNFEDKLSEKGGYKSKNIPWKNTR